MHKFYISLGSNMGDSSAMLEEALSALNSHPELSLQRVSSRYSTEPQGYREQPWFCNQAAMGECGMDAEELLCLLLITENSLGRERDPNLHFGPRRIDIDLLLFDDLVMQTPRLTLPHPRMAERAFVLVPLLELDPLLKMPDGRPLSSILASLTYRQEGNRIYQN